MTRLLRLGPCCLVVFALVLVDSTRAQQGAKGGEWRTYGGDEASTRYAPLDQINRTNIKNMRVAWVWKSDSLLPGAQPASETTPIMVNGVLYFTMDQRRYVIAANAERRVRNQRSVRRITSREQPLFRQPGLSRHPYRKNDLVLSARPSRHLGLRHAAASDSCRS